jgi:probable F420-dependent oxidoreductase
MKVRIGIGVPAAFDEVASFWRWVALCEESALDSVWCSDRLLSTDPTLEPMTTVAAICGATSRLKFGFNAMTLPTRDPVTLAKECASLDHLSGGRLLPVFGVGRAQKRSDGSTVQLPGGRGTRANEALEIMTRLWAGERVTFEGNAYSVHEAAISPLPTQQPMPMWIGGVSEAAIRRTARWGNGWISGLSSPEETAEAVTAIKREAQAIGRSIDPEHFGATIPYRLGTGSEAADPSGLAARLPSELAVVGEPDALLERVRAHRAAGISKFVAVPLARGDADVLEQTRLLAEQVAREVNRMT